MKLRLIQAYNSRYLVCHLFWTKDLFLNILNSLENFLLVMIYYVCRLRVEMMKEELIFNSLVDISSYQWEFFNLRELYSYHT
jgi:hypothetical protein